MEILDPTTAFDALAHPTRLAVFRLLIPVGGEGLAAGDIAAQLDLPATGLSFHLDRLVNADLLRRRRDGRHLYYAANYARLAELVDFLAGDCAAVPEGCLPECGSVASTPEQLRRTRCSPSSSQDAEEEMTP